MSSNFDERQTLYWDLHDFGSGRGLEIGPLHRTIVARDQADVRYVDVHDQAGLRAHYDGDAAVDPALIPEIDYALIQEDGTTLGLAEATREGAPFEWVMASHVIEHVPDLIGWLGELAEVTQDDGTLVLAVPDRRYCFDVNRPPTSVGQLIAAHQDGDTRPSVRAVYDYFSSVVDADIHDLWSGTTPDYSRRIHSLVEAGEKVEETLSGTYVDCHVWLFSPQSFVEQMHELRITGRSAWAVEEIVATPVHDLEFRVRMRRLPRGADTTAEQPGEVTPTVQRPDWLTPVTPDALVAHLQSRVADLEERLSGRREQVRKLRRQRDRQAKKANRAGRRLAELRGSRQWKAGGLALVPLRAISRRRRARS